MSSKENFEPKVFEGGFYEKHCVEKSINQKYLNSEILERFSTIAEVFKDCPIKRMENSEE